MPKMRVHGIGVDPAGTHTVLVLQETAPPGRYLPVAIGEPEAHAILLAQQGFIAPRPVTHQLILAVVDALGRRVELVRIAELRDGVFHAELALTGGTRVPARTSDAVALALHAKVGIWAEETVLERAGEPAPGGVPEDEPSTTSGGPAEDEDELQRFRRFLDAATPEDFDPS